MYHKSKKCKTCFKRLRGDFKFVTLDYVNQLSESNSPNLKEQLLTLVPEMKLDDSEDVILCNPCFIALRTGYEFKKMCQLNQSKSQNHDIEIIPLEAVHAAIVENCTWEVHYAKTGNCLTCGEIFEKRVLMYQHAEDNYCEYICDICDQDQTMACHYIVHNLEPRVDKVKQPDEPSISFEFVNVPLPRADSLIETLKVMKREKEEVANDQLKEKEEVADKQVKEVTSG